MAYDSLSLSQPLRGGGYNQYLLSKMQNKNTPQSAIAQTEQNFSRQTLLDNVSGFASELRSQNLVKAMATIQTSKSQIPPTLAEQGAEIDENGTVTLPSSQKSPATPENPQKTITLAQNQAIPLKEKTSMALQGMKAIALDSRSLGILSRISAHQNSADKNSPHSNTMHFDEQKNYIQNKFEEISESFSLGKLSEKYESANRGSQSIGYDKNGGTSYGTYQLSSRAGTFSKFVDFLKNQEPEWATALKNAGNSNTGSKNGSVPDTWKELCAENPKRMKELEHDFIVKSHYEPVFHYMQEKWKGAITPALKEVLFSTSVQHGVTGAKRIIDQALSSMQHSGNPPKTETVSLADSANALYMEAFEQPKPVKKTNALQNQAELIKNIYENRKDKFSSSTPAVQEAAKKRMIHEQKEALAMLG